MRTTTTDLSAAKLMALAREVTTFRAEHPDMLLEDVADALDITPRMARNLDPIGRLPARVQAAIEDGSFPRWHVDRIAVRARISDEEKERIVDKFVRGLVDGDGNTDERRRVFNRMLNAFERWPDEDRRGWFADADLSFLDMEQRRRTADQELKEKERRAREARKAMNAHGAATWGPAGYKTVTQLTMALGALEDHWPQVTPDMRIAILDELEEMLPRIKRMLDAGGRAPVEKPTIIITTTASTARPPHDPRVIEGALG